MQPKKLGIIGGMGSRAGSLFFQRVIEYSPATTDQDFIEILMHNNSRIPDRTRAILYREQSPLAEITRSIHILNNEKVEVIVLPCITSYYYFNELSLCTDATIIHPVNLLHDHLTDNYPDIQKIGLLATTGTIKSQLIHRALQKRGIETVTLNDHVQENVLMQALYMKGGLKSAVVSPEAKSMLLSTIPLLEDAGAQLIVAACSEIPTVLNQDMVDLPFIDMMDLLARETIKHCYRIDS